MSRAGVIDVLKVLAVLAVIGLAVGISESQTIPSGALITITGKMTASNGIPSKNSTLTFKVTQPGLIGGTGIVLSDAATCFTSTDGSVVGMQNPTQAPLVTAQFSGTLPSGNYSVRYTWVNAAGGETLPSNAGVVQLSGTGSILITPPAGAPAGSTAARAYVNSVGSAETLQITIGIGQSGSVSVPLVAGASLPTANSSLCQQAANDSMWPISGYQVNMVDSNGNTFAGFPMTWQLIGPGTTINIGNGLPTWRGPVYWPAPLLQQPTNHALQSVSGPVSLLGYNLLNAGAIGVGTSTPGYPLDVENGAVNASGGFVYNGGVGVSQGQCLVASSTPPYTFGPGACTAGLSLYYQSVSNNGSGLPQRGTTNFTGGLQAGDDGGNGRTNVSIANTSVSPGSYTNPNITVGSDGRITSASNGGVSPGTRVCNSNGCYVQASDGTTYAWGVSTGTPSGSATGLTITFPISFTTNPNVTTTAVGIPSGDGNDHPMECHVKSITTTGGAVIISLPTQVSGSGYDHFSGSEYCQWHAFGY